MEPEELPPVTVGSEPRIGRHRGAYPARSGHEERDEAPGQLPCDLLQVHPPAAPGGELHEEGVAVEEVVALERLDEQVVDRHPYRAAPVGVPAEEPRARLRGLVVDAEGLAGDVDRVRVVAVPGR